MKIKILIITGIFFLNNSFSQDIVKSIMDFYNNADMICYKDNAQKRMMIEYNLFCQWDSIYRLHSTPPDIDLHKSKTVPVLNIQFVNTVNYEFSDDIYNNISIDSVWCFSFFCVDKRNNIYAGVNFANPHISFWENKDLFKANKKEKHLYKKINKYKPDLILRCAMLSGGIGKKLYDDGYMFIKGDKIYKYMFYKGKVYELNDFFRRNSCPDNPYCYLNLSNIRRFLSQTYIPIIFQNFDNDYRKTNNDLRSSGNSPNNEKMICPND